MVSDWQGGDISKLFPALSGKEDLSMGEDKKADKKRKRIVPKAPVQMIISRGYVIMAMEDCGFSKKDIRRVVGQLYEVFDLNSVEDAKEKYLSSPY